MSKYCTFSRGNNNYKHGSAYASVKATDYIDQMMQKSATNPACLSRILPATSFAAALMAATAMSFASRAHAESAAPAAAAPAATVAEVVVTAQKHVSTVQKTTASIVAVTGVDLQNRGITSLASLAQGTPGVSLKS